MYVPSNSLTGVDSSGIDLFDEEEIAVGKANNVMIQIKYSILK